MHHAPSHTHTHLSFQHQIYNWLREVATTPGVGQFGEPFLHCGWLGRTLPFQHQPTTPPFWLGFLELGGLETGQHDPVGGVRGRLEKILEGPCCTCAQTQPFQLFFSNFSWFKVAVKRLKKANIISKTCPGDLMANSCNNKCFKHVKHANQPPFLPIKGGGQVHFVLEDPKSNYQALSAFILGYITAQLQTLIMVASNRLELAMPLKNTGDIFSRLWFSRMEYHDHELLRTAHDYWDCASSFR